MCLLNRSILLELAKIFVLALSALTSILVLAVVVMEAQQQGLDPFQVLTLIPLVIPTTLPYTVPTTTLFATCVVYGRLAHDNEVLAVKSAGVNLLRIVRPALFLGLCMSIVTALLYFHVIPATYHAMKTVFLNDVESILYARLRRDGRFTHPKLDYVIYVRQVKGRKLVDAMFMHRDSSGEFFDAIGHAREAELRVDNAHRKVHVHMKNCRIITHDGRGSGIVKDKIWTVDFPPNLIRDRKSRRTDMSWPELDHQIAQLKKKLAELDSEITLVRSMIEARKGPSSLPKHIANLEQMKEELQRNIYVYRGEKHRRLAVAAGCFCFVLIGCPVGIWFSRSDYLSAFVVCFLPIVLIYYPLIICGDNLVKSGELDPLIAMWPANILLVIIAMFLYRKLLKN